MNFDQFLTSELERIADAGLRRSLRILDSPQGPEVLLRRPGAGELLLQRLSRTGSSSKASRGGTEALEEAGSGHGSLAIGLRHAFASSTLEEALARFKQTEAAVTFSSGYSAALGTIPALVGKWRRDHFGQALSCLSCGWCASERGVDAGLPAQSA